VSTRTLIPSREHCQPPPRDNCQPPLLPQVTEAFSSTAAKVTMSNPKGTGREQQYDIVQTVPLDASTMEQLSSPVCRRNRDEATCARPLCTCRTAQMLRWGRRLPLRKHPQNQGNSTVLLLLQPLLDTRCRHEHGASTYGTTSLARTSHWPVWKCSAKRCRPWVPWPSYTTACSATPNGSTAVRYFKSAPAGLPLQERAHAAMLQMTGNPAETIRKADDTCA
jgi:hypothetical protein